MKNTNTTELPSKCITLDPKNIKPIVWLVDSVPEQRLRDKMAKSRNWSVNWSKMDKANKKFLYEIISGPRTVQTEITFEEACKDFGWASFKLTNNGETIVPTPLKID